MGNDPAWTPNRRFAHFRGADFDHADLLTVSSNNLRATIYHDIFDRAMESAFEGWGGRRRCLKKRTRRMLKIVAAEIRSPKDGVWLTSAG